MDAKEDGEFHDGQPSSPIAVLEQFSLEAIGVAGEALKSVTGGSDITPPPGHRRCQSEVVTKALKRNDSYEKFKTHVQKAWRLGGKSREDGSPLGFNPEVLANQKRQWYQLNSKTLVFNFVLLYFTISISHYDFYF